MSDGTIITIRMTPEEKAALLQAATDARAKADAAVKAADDAGGADEALNAAAETAKGAAAKAEADAQAAEEDGGGSPKDALDLDKELEEEQKRGKPDPKKAAQAFKEREDARKLAEGEAAAAAAGADDDKPLTRKDLAEIEQRAYTRLQADRALEIARNITSSEKEAQLVLAKWRNRSFPANLPLGDQIDEAYAITHRKKILGERDEALRALRGRNGVNSNPAESHRDAPVGGEPKLSDADKTALHQGGFAWDGTKKLYTKKLSSGKTLCTDAKRTRTWVV